MISVIRSQSSRSGVAKALYPALGAMAGLMVGGPLGVVPGAKLGAITALGGSVAALGIATQERHCTANSTRDVSHEDDVTADEEDDDAASIASSNIEAVEDDDLANLIASSISEETMTSRGAVNGEGERHSLPSLELEENLVNECVERRAKQSSDVVVTDVSNAVFSCEAEVKEIEVKADEDSAFEEVVLSPETQTENHTAVMSHTYDVMTLENETAKNTRELDVENEAITEADEPEQTISEWNVETVTDDATVQLQSTELACSSDGDAKKTRNVATQTSDVGTEASKFQVGFLL